jgi:hypothetical protein
MRGPALSICLPSMGLCLLLLLIGWSLSGGSPVSGCGTMIRRRTVGMVRSVRVLFSGGVAVMGMVRVTMLHPRGMGKLEFPSH